MSIGLNDKVKVKDSAGFGVIVGLRADIGGEAAGLVKQENGITTYFPLRCLEKQPDNRLLETVFDMSYTAGFYRYTSEDSRTDFAEILAWAEEFEANFDEATADYMESVDRFVMEKIHAAGWKQREDK